MSTRIVMIHPGPSATCPCDVCRNDGSDATPTRTDSQGREIEWREDGTPTGSAIGGLMWTLAFWLVVGIVLVVVGSAS